MKRFDSTAGPIGGPVPLLLLMLVAAASGCGQGRSAPGAPSKDPPPSRSTLVSNWGAYRVTVEPLAGTVPLNEPFDLRVWIEDTPAFAPGRSGISRVDVAVDAEMPAHHHGMTRIPQVTRLPGGAYLAKGLLFHMPGHWQLYVDITEDGRTDRAEMGMDLQ